MYSNCLFEAIKAKIKDPKNVMIIKLPKIATNRGHWGWTDGEYFYHSYNTNRKWYNKWWHPSKTKKVEFAVFESFILKYLRYQNIKTKRKIIKNLHLRSNEFVSNKWTLVWVDEREKFLPKKEIVDYLKKIQKGSVYFKVIENKIPKIVSYEELLQIKGFFKWKIVSAFDEDWEAFYDDNSFCSSSEIQ